MRRKYNELYIGAAVSGTIILIVATILFLQKSDIIQQGIEVNLQVQNAEGIRKGGQVLYEGLNVGTIRNATLTDKGVLLQLRITGIDSIPEDSKFVIGSTSLIGGKAVEITPGTSVSYLKNGAYVRGQSAVGFSDILRGGERISSDVDQVARNIGTLTNTETRAKVGDALDRINESVALIHESLKTNLNDIHETIRNMESISADNKAPIDSIVSRLSERSKELAIAIDNTEKITGSLNQIITGLKEGRGTAGKMLTDNQLYNKLDSTLTNLNALIKDIKEHPGRYVHVSIF